MIITRKPIKGECIEFQGHVVLFIRPFPASEGIFAPTNVKELTDASWVRFEHCLQGWKGIKDEDEETDFEYNDENKKFLFDYAQELVFFAVTEARKMEQKVSDSLGN